MRYTSCLAALAAMPFAILPATAQTGPIPGAPAVIADGTLLDVSAEGSTTRTPDVATVRAGVVTQGATAAAALAENAQRMTRVIEALRKTGVAARDLQTATVSLSPQYRYADGLAPAITGYQANNSVTVRFRDITRAGATLDALANVGANQIEGPTLTLDDPEAALDEARVDAVKIARARAELYARAAGLVVSRIVSIAENGSNDGSVPQPGPVMFLRAAKATPTPIAPGEARVSVSVAVRFLLK